LNIKIKNFNDITVIVGHKDTKRSSFFQIDSKSEDHLMVRRILPSIANLI